ncbi:MAG: hypothetical protein ACFFAO_14210 [Candidatus Hermodarchaeota archaeon]
MEKLLKTQFLLLLKLEKHQKTITKYIIKIGKWLLFFLPIILVVITVMTFFLFPKLPEALKFSEQTIEYQILYIAYLITLGLYFLNSLALILCANWTKKSFEMRLKLERKRGRPIESLRGFNFLTENLKRTLYLFKIISFICLTSVVLFIVMLIIGDLYLGFAAAGFSLFGLGLALLIRSLNLNMNDVNGLQDFYKPNTHSIFLDNFFSEIVANHLDPVTLLKWDDFITGMNEILNPKFIQMVKKRERREKPITFALEKFLLLYYLRFQDVIDEGHFLKELKEIVDLTGDKFNVENGFLINKNRYFNRKDFYKIFHYIKKYNSGAFNIIDRLQLELTDNIENLSEDKIYMDYATQEVVYIGDELNVMVYLYNNTPKKREYRLKIIASGFDPKELTFDIKVEGRGTFEIPSQTIPLTTSDDSPDIVGVLSGMIENGDTMWLALEPRIIGEQTMQIFLETAGGEIIEGQTCSIKVSKDIKTKIRKLSSIGSLLGGLAVPLSRVIAAGGLPF